MRKIRFVALLLALALLLAQQPVELAPHRLSYIVRHQVTSHDPRRCQALRRCRALASARRLVRISRRALTCAHQSAHIG